MNIVIFLQKGEKIMSMLSTRAVVREGLGWGHTNRCQSLDLYNL